MISRIAPVVVATTAGLLVLADFFIDAAVVDALGLYLIRTASVVTAFALILGLTNVATVHFRKIVNRDKSWGYSVVLLGALVFTLTAGFLTGGPGSVLMRRVFDSVLFPLEATIFSLLAFFLVAAVYRAFRVKSFESGLFVVFGIIVLLGQMPVGALLWDQLPIIKDWVLDVPALAGMRGILLGVGLGTAATGMRVLMGIDRPYAE
ncbi:MAG: hypothetical protein H8E35_04695 [Ardenticatenia bacterium]|nr:hypothetical protein [Ardenticatenia bacterium]